MICFATVEELEAFVEKRTAPILHALQQARQAANPRRCNATTVLQGHGIQSCEGDIDHRGDHGTADGLRWSRT
jgi:hypothetical protein